jgi:replicative DNA helicase
MSEDSCHLIRCERAIAGVAILDPSVIDSFEAEIGAYAFVDEIAGQTWRTACLMRSQGKPAGDVKALALELRTKNVTAADIAKLAEDASQQGDYEYYVSELVSEECRRKLRKVGSDLLSGLDSKRDPESLRSELITRLSSVQTVRQSKSVADSMREVLERSLNPQEIEAITTGIPVLDSALGGLRGGQLAILAARPSVGKSALAVQVAVDCAKDGKRVLFISLEMSSSDLVTRILASELGSDFGKIVSGSLSQQDVEYGRGIATAFEKIPFELCDQRNLSIDRLVGLVRSRVANQGLDLLVIDYLGLLQGDRRKPRWEAITEISHSLKSLALAEEIPILCLAQLNRESEGEVPKLSHLRDSGAIEQDADVVMLLHRERGEGDTELHLAKNRNGKVGRVELSFDAKAMRFESLVKGWHP